MVRVVTASAVALIKRELSIPVITNGNVRNAADLVRSLQLTGADGVMSAEGALDDPAIFGRAIVHVAAERKHLKKAIRMTKAERRELRVVSKTTRGPEVRAALKRCKEVLVESRREERALPMLPPPPSKPKLRSSVDGLLPSVHPQSAPLDLCDQYLDLVEAHPADMTHIIFHVRRIAKQLLTQYELLPILVECSSLDEARMVVRRCREYAEGLRTWLPGAEARAWNEEKRRKRRAANAKRRAEWLERMVAKARKEGKPDGHYTSNGKEPPTQQDVLALQTLGAKEQTMQWRSRFGQHCQGWYLNGACPHLADERGCGFLHGDDDTV